MTARSWVIALVSLAHLTIQFLVLGSLTTTPSIPVLADGWPEFLWVILVPYVVGVTIRPSTWRDWRWLVSWTLLLTTYPLALPLVLGVAQTWWWIHAYRHFPAPTEKLGTRLRTAPSRAWGALVRIGTVLMNLATLPHRITARWLEPKEPTPAPTKPPSGKVPAAGRKNP